MEGITEITFVKILGYKAGPEALYSVPGGGMALREAILAWGVENDVKCIFRDEYSAEYK